MKKSIIASIILGIGIVFTIIIFQISGTCYPKGVEIDFDLRELESGSMGYASCLDLQKKIENFNQRCDPDFSEIRC
jgi:hypothetical protein